MTNTLSISKIVRKGTYSNIGAHQEGDEDTEIWLTSTQSYVNVELVIELIPRDKEGNPVLTKAYTNGYDRTGVNASTTHGINIAQGSNVYTIFQKYGNVKPYGYYRIFLLQLPHNYVNDVEFPIYASLVGEGNFPNYI